MIKYKKFTFIKTEPWASCLFCSTKDNVKSLDMKFYGGNCGTTITICDKCCEKLISALKKEIEK